MQISLSIASGRWAKGLSIKILDAGVLRNHWRKILLKKKKNGQIKGNDKHGDADSLLYKMCPMFIPNFKIIGLVVPDKSLTQISLCIGMRDGKKEKEKAK